MSGAETEEREIEVVQGTIKGVIVKGVDKWQVEVQPPGSDYTKKLWTKDASLVEAMPAKIGQYGAFVCGASHWTNEGKQVRSLWIQQEGTEGVPIEAAESPSRVATPAPAPQAATPSGDGMSKAEWARKDSAIHMMAAIKAAAAALTHTIPSDPTPEELTKYLERCKRLSWDWWKRAEAVRTGDDSDVPFLSEADDEIPY